MVNTAATYKNSGFVLGSYTARSNMEYYFFRVYSRALTAEEIARKAMEIAADICVYTNHSFVVETLDEA